MKIIYNNQNYLFNRSQTIDELLNNKKFLKLPINKWKEILILKEGSLSFNMLHKVLLALINYYDTSEHINSFMYKGKSYWLDKNTRVGLVNLANSTNESIQLFLNPEFITITPDLLKQYLSEIEVYASKCYIITQMHLKNVQNLNTIDDLLNYDYTSGYPDKIILE